MNIRSLVLLAVVGGVGCGDNGAKSGDASVPPSDTPPDTSGSPVVGLDHRPSNTTCKAFTPPGGSGSFTLVNKFPNVSMTNPTGMFQRPGDNARWFVTERGGRILSFPNDPTVTNADVKVVLDLRSVTWQQVDCSMSGIAFPPDFATSHRAYVSYCYLGPQTGNHMQIRISRFTTADGGLTLDPASEELVMTLDHPHDAAHPEVGLHGSDAMRFGADGYLYESIGDGGPQGVGGGTQAQDPHDMRGKMLRLDVHDITKHIIPDTPTDWVAGRQRVAADIPAGNPYADGVNGSPWVYAIGFRNPWQWHFDRQTNKIWLGDVGFNTWEEVDRDVKAGENRGWGNWEGNNCSNFAGLPCQPSTGFTFPILDYHHGSTDDQGNAVTGGVVYRGQQAQSLKGSYVFGDYSGAKIWRIKDVDNIGDDVHEAPKELMFGGFPVSAFGEDQDGEIYAVALYNTATYPSGHIYQLVETTPTMPLPGQGPPALLSDTGCVDPNDPTKAADGLVPFEPSATLWSDGATKRRWLALPDDQTIAVGSDGDFTFPTGSVLMKEFSLNGQRIETRFFVRQNEDGHWAGYSYKWREDGTDADLVDAGGATEPVGMQTWTFPSRVQCGQCHTLAAGTTLGPELAQLNHTIEYPETGRTANQLETLWSVGMLDHPSGVTTANTVSLANIADGTRSTEERARGYLHVNCSMCHRPDGPTYTPLDLRYYTPLHDAGVCNVLPTITDLKQYIPGGNAKIFAPGEPDQSVMWQRMNITDPSLRMPPIARSISDYNAVSVVGNWILGTTACP
ncbi:MAG: PQQ-dependent sugar dehydrogenase [Kofleriaceae bacterium]